MALFFPPRRTPVLVSAGLMLGLVAGLRAGPFFVDRVRCRADDGPAARLVAGGTAGRIPAPIPGRKVAIYSCRAHP